MPGNNMYERVFCDCVCLKGCTNILGKSLGKCTGKSKYTKTANLLHRAISLMYFFFFLRIKKYLSFQYGYTLVIKNLKIFLLKIVELNKAAMVRGHTRIHLFWGAYLRYKGCSRGESALIRQTKPYFSEYLTGKSST